MCVEILLLVRGSIAGPELVESPFDFVIQQGVVSILLGTEKIDEFGAEK
jgi:hypothetical protein